MRTFKAMSCLLTLSLLSISILGTSTPARADDTTPARADDTTPARADDTTPARADDTTPARTDDALAPPAPAPAPQNPPPTAYSSAPAPVAPAPMAWAAGGAAPNMHGPSVWGILPWGGVGVGGRFMMPLAIRPLLVNTAVRDNFALEFGADLLHWNYNAGAPGFAFNYSWTEVLPVVGAMWNIWINDRFAFYPKIEAGYAFGWFSNVGTNMVAASYGGIFADGAVGALYNLGGGLTLRAEAGSSGLKVGAGWLF